jgi:carboxypeptidase C (cathepsin A)
LACFYASDWICNVAGVEAVVSQLTFPQSAEFSATSLTNYTVNGEVVGVFKTAGKLSYLEVFDAGHEVPAYQPAAAFQAFNQTMNQQALYST